MRGNAVCSGGASHMADANRKILCIDDDREIAGLIAEELADRRFEVSVAFSGQEGILAIMRSTPELVLCDINMPHMTGFEVLERLNEIAPRFGHIPFIFLTAFADRDSELRGRKLGADDYVSKPIDFERLHLIIEARLGKVARTRFASQLVRLKDREIEILTLVARGKTSAEIAVKLGLSKRTVDFHIDNARMRLRTSTRTEAVSKAVASGLIKP
jgi:DNA-binding NarL/FixJ family response regulator